MIQPIRIVLADDHTVVRKGIREFLEADRATGMQVLELLHELNSMGQNVVMVTHDALAASHADRIVQILDGQIVSESERD
jgi:ABC-type lipoprotein export system ATPase subunit